MHTCESIRVLDVSDNQSGFSSLTQSTGFSMMSHLSAMLIVNSTLTILNVSKLGITVRFIDLDLTTGLDCCGFIG